MRQPYEGEEDYRGYPVLTDEQVYGRLKSALERNVQILATATATRRRSSTCLLWSGWSKRWGGVCAGR